MSLVPPGQTLDIMRKMALLVVSCLAALAGCSQPYVNEARLARGLVIVLTGIEGRSVLNEDICHGLNDGGVDCAIELVDWTSPLPGGYLISLRDKPRNMRKAAELAERVVRYQKDHPGKPVFLLGQSGGAAIAVWATEALPPASKIEGIILLAPAISGEYELDQAMLNSGRGIVSFHSQRDWVILGAGTTIYGTMDGKHGPAAGRTGFQTPQGPRAQRYRRKLFQIAWAEQADPAGHYGGHLSSGSRRFVARYVAPLVQLGQWDQHMVVRMREGKNLLPEADWRTQS